MIALAIVIAVLLLLCLIRVGIIAEYADEGFLIKATVGPVRIQVLPSKKKQKRKKAPKKQIAGGAVKAGRLESLKNQLPSLHQALARLKKKLVINELTICFMAAGADDPASAALYFGVASAGYGVILPLLENNFTIKKRDLRATIDFGVTEPYIYVRAKLSLAVWELVYVGFDFLKNLVKSENTKAKIRKAV